jgi:hypothetical protein
VSKDSQNFAIASCGLDADPGVPLATGAEAFGDGVPLAAGAADFGDGADAFGTEADAFGTEVDVFGGCPNGLGTGRDRLVGLAPGCLGAAALPFGVPNWGVAEAIAPKLIRVKTVLESNMFSVAALERRENCLINEWNVYSSRLSAVYKSLIRTTICCSQKLNELQVAKLGTPSRSSKAVEHLIVSIITF